jgi:glutaminyl-tRNA synthetase
MRAHRGTLREAGRESPYRARSVAENLDLFRRMRAGEFADGTHVLRARIDMASPNMNLRDPVLYRIRHAHHHRTGDKWCIYPMYDYTHCISDALERITHSICTLEFEDHRPLYDWVLDELGAAVPAHPQQIEFARLNLTYVVMSKRYLKRLVDENYVDGWDDPRMPTLVGCRRRGFTAGGFRLFAERIGVSKAHQWISMSVLEDCMREDMNESAQRRIAVLKPLKLILDNYPEGQEETCHAPNHPQKPESGKRELPFTRELWIERDDFTETPPKGYFRLSPGAEVRLRYAYIVKCVGVDRDANGEVIAVHCTYDPATRSGTAGAETRKVKGNIHWLSTGHALPAEVRLYDRLFSAPYPGKGPRVEEAVASEAEAIVPAEDDEEDSGKAHASEPRLEHSYLDDLNPEAKIVITALLESALAHVPAESRFQFERHGYFVADMKDHAPGRPVFNRAVTLRDSWTKHGAS